MTIHPHLIAKRVVGHDLPATLPVCTSPVTPPLGVLSISRTGDDHTAVLQSVSGMHCTIETAESCRDAIQRLTGGGIAIVVCERELPDGTWRDILEHLGSSPERPLLIVTSIVADGWLWAEVLNTGGDDVLAKPFNAKETRHVMETACLKRRAPGRRRQVASGT